MPRLEVGWYLFQVRGVILMHFQNLVAFSFQITINNFFMILSLIYSWCTSCFKFFLVYLEYLFHMHFNLLNPFVTDTVSYRNQSIDLWSKSMDWFLYDIGLCHERVKTRLWSIRISKCSAYYTEVFIRDGAYFYVNDNRAALIEGGRLFEFRWLLDKTRY